MSERQIRNLKEMIDSMKHGEVKYFHEFLKDEAQLILSWIANQSGDKNYYVETNGTATNMSTITKFRKLLKQS